VTHLPLCLHTHHIRLTKQRALPLQVGGSDTYTPCLLRAGVHSRVLASDVDRATLGKGMRTTRTLAGLGATTPSQCLQCSITLTRPRTHTHPHTRTHTRTHTPRTPAHMHLVCLNPLRTAHAHTIMQGRRCGPSSTPDHPTSNAHADTHRNGMDGVPAKQATFLHTGWWYQGPRGDVAVYTNSPEPCMQKQQQWPYMT
jgi:hypothetical protein